jgi:hypothetical protein
LRLFKYLLLIFLLLLLYLISSDSWKSKSLKILLHAISNAILIHSMRISSSSSIKFRLFSTISLFAALKYDNLHALL